MLKKYLKENVKIVDKEIEKVLQRSPSLSPVLHRAIRYAVLSGGKRLRPILVLAACHACGGTRHNAMDAAIALELIHTYSLIHDDLPAMDDDDLRRGRPTVHKKFGEAIAILAGDALLTKAFEILAKNAKIKGLFPNRYIHMIGRIAQAAGMNGMVGGQSEDIRHHNTGSAGSMRTVLTIHAGKTASLLSACTEAGALCTRTSPVNVRRLARYGFNVGLAFQVMDDVLDIVGNKAKLGKRGSDADNRKLTFPAVKGIEGSRSYAQKKIDEALTSLRSFGEKAEPLRWIARYIIERDH